MLFLRLASPDLNLPRSFPLSSYSPVSCFLLLFSHSVILHSLSSSPPLPASVSPLSFGFLRGRVTLLSDLQGITPRFVPLHLHALMSLEQHTQPTNLQTCPAGILHDVLMRCVVVRCSCFLTQRESQSRLRFGSFTGLILFLCGGVGSVRYTLSCCRALLLSLAVSLLLLPSTFPYPSLSPSSFVPELTSV